MSVKPAVASSAVVREAAFEQRVGRHRHAVDEVLDGRRLDSASASGSRAAASTPID